MLVEIGITLTGIALAGTLANRIGLLFFFAIGFTTDITLLTDALWLLVAALLAATVGKLVAETSPDRSMAWIESGRPVLASEWYREAKSPS